MQSQLLLASVGKGTSNIGKVRPCPTSYRGPPPPELPIILPYSPNGGKYTAGRELKLPVQVLYDARTELACEERHRSLSFSGGVK